MTRQNDLAPELHNDEQDDERAQAQTVADEAIDRATAPLGADTEKKEKDYSIVSDGAEDTLDKMQPEGGEIDMGAYDGEPNHDDYVEKYGEGSRPGDTPVNADS